MIVQRAFAATPDAPAQARRLLLVALADDPRVDAALLATSELVTNALRHAELAPEDEIRVHVRSSAGRVRVSVSNPGGGFARPRLDRRAPDERAGGWGLPIVASVASSWAVGGQGGQTHAWFEL